MRTPEEWAKRLTVFDDDGVAAIVKAAQREAIEAAAKVADPLPLFGGSDIEKQAHDIRAVIAAAIRALIPTDAKDGA